LGWEPIVFAADPEDLEEPPDPGFAALLPENLRVVRFRAWNPRLTRLFGLGDLGIRSLEGLRGALGDFFSREKADAVIIHGPPWFCFTLGPWLRQTHGVPYLLDYIDPWVSNPLNAYRWRSKAHWYRLLARQLEPKVTRLASGIFTISEHGKRELREHYPEIAGTPIVPVPYGFEPSDYLSPADERPESQEKRILRYIGARLPTSVPIWEALFGALARLRERQPEAVQALRLELIGTTYAVDDVRPLIQPLAVPFGVDDLVFEAPARVPYSEALRLTRRADGLLVIGTMESHYAASKIFPTLAARLPMLGAVHAESDVVSLLDAVESGGVAKFASENDLGAIEEHFLETLPRFLDHSLPAPAAAAVDAVLAPYTARKMTERVATLLDSITAAQPTP
jgi:glycosyltransferase involved in cell wall biosynthesis